MADLPERLPLPLSERLASASSAIYNRFGREVDVAIGGIPFMLATTNETPQSYETVPVRKEQFDTERDPGEQSLSGWWRRSQASFHFGAGYLYEPRDTDEDFAGFHDSSGVDVFTPGKAKLLRKLEALTTPTPMKRVFSRLGVSGVLSDAGDLYEVSGSSLVLKWTSVSGNFTDYIYSANFHLIITDTGRLYKSTTGAFDSTAYWALSGLTGVTDPKMLWAKYRLWIASGPAIWQPSVSGTPDTGAVPIAPIWTNPQPNWEYTCMAEGPAAVYFGGHDGEQSSIHVITLDPDGGLPTLSGASTAAVLPSGERIYHLAVVGGQYIGIGTNLGFRVGRVESSGSITYGPLLLDRRATENETVGFFGVTALTAIGDSFIVALSDDSVEARTYRVNTGFEIEELVFPYARDVTVPGAAVGTYFKSLDASYGSSGLPIRIVGILSNGNYYEQSYTDLVDDGWIESSRIRFRTTEPKSFKFLSAEIEPLEGQLALSLVKEGGSVLPVGSITRQGEIHDPPFPISSSTMKYCQVRIDFTRSVSDPEAGPTFLSYLLRALPAVKPQRLITLPLICMDKEQARSGQAYGGEGYARNRLTALQLLEDAAETVIYQDFSDPNREGVFVTIESIRFVQTSPPKPHRVEGGGGILLLELRTAAA